jgi:hypothetical protein
LGPPFNQQATTFGGGAEVRAGGYAAFFLALRLTLRILKVFIVREALDDRNW